MIRTKYVEKRRTENVVVEKEAEFKEDITHRFYNFDDIFEEFFRYNFSEFADVFREEFNCQVRCHMKYYLDIVNGRRGLFFGRFLVGNLSITDRGEPSLFVLPSFDERGNTTEEINHILQFEIYTEVKVCVAMDVKFVLFASLDALSEYEREQIEDQYDDDDDEGYQENQELSQPVETPFVTDTCSICLTEKPNIIIIPCLHQSVCSQCEDRGKLINCPTCRGKILKKLKI